MNDDITISGSNPLGAKRKRIDGEGGGAGGSVGKQYLDGFGSSTKKNIYQTLSPSTSVICQKIAYPTSSDFQNQSSFTWEIKAGRDEVIKFSENCFNLKYLLIQDNPDVQGQAIDWHRLERICVAPLTGNSSCIYLNQCVPDFCFSQIQVFYNGKPLPSSQMSDMNWLYTLLNRTFTTPGTRKQTFGEDTNWICNSIERNYTEYAAAVPQVLAAQGVVAQAAIPEVPRFVSPDLIREIQETATYDDRDPALATPTYIRFSMDSTFPMSTHNLTLKALTKQKNTPMFLPPESVLTIVLSTRINRDALIERCWHTIEQSFEGAVIPHNYLPNLEVRIKGLSIEYESAIIASEKELAAIKKSTYNYLCDVPILLSKPLAGGLQSEVVELQLPAYCNLVYLCFLHENQIHFNATQFSSIAPRLMFPRNLQRVQLSMMGRPNILAAQGFQNIGLVGGALDETWKSYHSWMIKQNLYSKPFSKFRPKTPGSANFEGALIVPLLPWKSPRREILQVDLHYSSPCLTKLYLRAVCMVQCAYTISPNKAITWQIV